MSNLSDNAKKVFNDLYSFTDESIDETFRRVANEFGTNEEETELAYELQKNNIWRPNTPVYLNAGTNHKIFSACFPKGTKVRTSDGLKNIEDIKVGDKVLTHSGKFKKVYDIMQREYDGDMYNINSIGFPNNFVECTEEHPFLAIKKEEFDCKRIKGTKCVPNSSRKCCFKRKNHYKNDCDYINKDYRKEWIQAKDLKKGDFITISFDDSVEKNDYIDINEFVPGYKFNESYIYYQEEKKINRFIKIDKDFMKLLGYYTAEGCSGNSGDIRFTFSINEVDYCNDVKDIITKIFDKEPYFIDNPEIGTRCIRLHSVILSKLLRILCGEKSTEKHLHEIITKSPYDLQESFLIGLFRGDGFISGSNSMRITLANFSLIYQVWEILMRCGMFFNFGYGYVSKNATWNHTQPFTLESTFNDENVKNFAEKVWNNIKFIKRKYNFDKSYKIDNHFVVPIAEITKTSSMLDVYNIEVEDDHSYTVMNINVHNCYVVGLQDSMNSIYDIANVSRKIFGYGAGVGIPIGNLREKEASIFDGEPDKAPEGRSSGPICFMKLYDAVGETTKSGGRVRRAAIMCSMQCWHPDVMDFITSKNIDGTYANMNISVTFTDKFMEHLEDNVPFPLVTPYDGSQNGTIKPKDLWNKLVEMAHRTGDPGVIFIDTVNKFNPLKKKLLMECCNPCGEQFLWPFNCCNLSAINVSKFVKEGEIDYKSIHDTAYQIAKLMDNVIDIMDYPDPRFEKNTKKYRPIGIGFMGLADLFYMLDIKYDSATGKRTAGKIMRTITCGALDASADIASEKGKFFEYEDFKEDVEDIVFQHIKGHWDEEVLKDKIKRKGLRNCAVSTVMPTGTTALSCDASYGMEPCFGLVFKKNLVDGSTMDIANPIFRDRFQDEEWYNEDLLKKIRKNNGSLKGIHGIPKKVRDVFVTAHDIKWKDRIDVQASIQKHCSNAISSTINLAKETPASEIDQLYKYAYEKGLKGVTIYRDGSKQLQPVSFSEDEKKVIESFDRPSKLSARVHKLDTGNGKMYVTVSSYDSKPIEVFLHVGKSGQVVNTFSEALGRVISIALQNGVSIDSIVKTLIGINSDKPTWTRFDESEGKMTQILSVPDGLAQLLKKFYSGKEQPEGIENSGEICPKCGTSFLLNIEGCSTCSDCGYSACA